MHVGSGLKAQTQALYQVTAYSIQLSALMASSLCVRFVHLSTLNPGAYSGFQRLLLHPGRKLRVHRPHECASRLESQTVRTHQRLQPSKHDLRSGARSQLTSPSFSRRSSTSVVVQGGLADCPPSHCDVQQHPFHGKL